MADRATDVSPTVRVVERLEERGLERYGWCMYEIIDPDALDLVADSGDPTTEIRFKVRDFRVTLYGDGRIVVQDGSDT